MSSPPNRQMLNAYQMPQDEMVRVQVWIDPADKYLLNSVIPLHGVETYMISSFYKLVCQEIRAAKIATYSPENASAVQSIIVRHLTALPVSGTRPDSHEQRGNNEVHQPHSNAANKPSDVHKTDKSRRGSGGRRTGGRKEA